MGRLRKKKESFGVATLQPHPSVLLKQQEVEEERFVPDEEKKPGFRPGIVYFKSVPKYMPLNIIKNNFSRFGGLGRSFFVPESKNSYENRQKFKGNRALRFVEGWLEFHDKKDAKMAARYNDTRKVGGKKRSAWYDDIWSVQYLRNVDWEDLISSRHLQKEKATRQFNQQVMEAQNELIE